MDKLKTTIENSYDRVAAIGPDLLVAILFLIGGVLVAFATKKLALSGIKRFYSGRLKGNAAWVSAQQFNWLAMICSRLIFWITIGVFIALTAEILGINVFEDWLKAIGNYVPNILAGILILITGFLLSRVFKDFLQKTLVAAGIRGAKNIALTGYVVSIAIVILMSVNQVGINLEFLTSIILVTVSSFLLCGAISFGFGSAPIVTNIISTYYLRKILKIGQNIENDSFSGRVIEINATSVHLQTENGLEVVPSSKLDKIGYRIKNVSN